MQTSVCNNADWFLFPYFHLMAAAKHKACFILSRRKQQNYSGSTGAVNLQAAPYFHFKSFAHSPLMSVLMRAPFAWLSCSCRGTNK